MAGYGNRTAPDYTPDNLTDEHASTRLDLTNSHSPPTYGAGFGNKRASQPSIPSTSPSKPSLSDPSEHDQVYRFNSQDRHGSAPYSNAHTYGSASTAGAGWGNKTGSFSHEGEGEGGDSRLGKVMERVGGLVGSKVLVEKGAAKRAEERSVDGEGPVAN